MATKPADNPAARGVPRDARPPHSAVPDDSYNHPQMHAHACADWEWLLDAGLIANRNPPPSPETIAAREANQRLFATIVRSRCGIW